MKKIIIFGIMLLFLLLCVSCVSAKQSTQIDLKTNSFGYCCVATLKDSNGKPIPNQFIDIIIEKDNGHSKKITKKRLDQSGKGEFYLGNGEFTVKVTYNGNSKYESTKTSKHFSIHKSDGKSDYYYYDDHNWGDNLRMDEYIYDNYWDEEIYDDPLTYDGEGY